MWEKVIYQFMWLEEEDDTYIGGLSPCYKFTTDDDNKEERSIPYYVQTDQEEKKVVEAAVAAVPIRSWPKFIPSSCLTREKLEKMNGKKLQWIAYSLFGLATSSESNRSLVDKVDEYTLAEQSIDQVNEDDGNEEDDAKTNADENEVDDDDAPVWVLEKEECGEDVWKDIHENIKRANSPFK